MNPTGNPLRILIVDDGVLNATEVLRKLKAAGMDAESVSPDDLQGEAVNPFAVPDFETLSLECYRHADPEQPEIEVRSPITYGPRHNVKKGKSRRW